jgi:hypothetical protein
MEAIWAQFPPVDPREASVLVQRLLFPQKLIVFPFRSGFRQECHLVRLLFDILFPKIYALGQFHNHRGH